MVSKSELEKRNKQSKNFYCGDKEILPKEYWRFGSRRECLSRGVGLGLYVVPDQNEKREIEKREYKRKKEREDRLKNHERGLSYIYKEEERDIKMLEKINDGLNNKKVYQKFLDKNFDKASRNSKLELGEIFKKLSILWKIEQKLLRKELKDREKDREKEKRNIY